MYTPEQYQQARILGAEYGDYVYHESLPYGTMQQFLDNEQGPLAGIYSTDPTPKSLMEQLGVDNPDEWDMDELCTAYETEFYNQLETLFDSEN